MDINAGERLIETIKPLAASTRRPGANAALGGFSGLFDLKAAGYKDPLLLAATDGVGTKLKVAMAANYHDKIGTDLVAMCVNDLVVQGAEPLLFLDYYATGKLSIALASKIIEGIAEGCREAKCALIGGETAEMPGLYQGKDYDLAGFALGAVEREGLLNLTNITPGDQILGLASSGLHANGFSLVRQIVQDTGHKYTKAAPFSKDNELGEILLRPTKIYVNSCLSTIRAGVIKGLAHITGGGLIENPPRILPNNSIALIDGNSWEIPSEFKWLAKLGRIQPIEMARTFNCGIGMIAIVEPKNVDLAKSLFETAGEKVWSIGKIKEGNGTPKVDIVGIGF